MANSVVFSARVYSIETIKKAAYRFCDVLSIDIIPRAHDIECVLHVRSGYTDDEVEAIISAFKNEVLDQDLRATIAKETERIRNVILAHALSKTGLQSSE